MFELELMHERPGLLVSVRSAEEAAVALAAGVDVVDVKEPSRGSLGAADLAVVADVVAVVCGRVPVSAALGELDDFSTIAPEARNADEGIEKFPRGVAFVKMGLAGCRADADWPSRWCAAMSAAGAAEPVAVVYADWRSAGAPAPNEVLTEARAVGCPALLVDTWDKTAGTLWDHWSRRSLARFMGEVQERGMAFVLAGSLSGRALAEAVRLRPDLVAVRGAVCDTGRGGALCPRRIESVRRAISEALRPAGACREE